MKRFFVFWSALLLVCFHHKASAEDPLEVTREMIAFTKSVHSLKFTLETNERIKGKMYREVSFCWLTVNPYRIYAIQSLPVKNLEVLYVSGANGNKVKIYPASFPWITVNLNPESPLFLEKHHHTALEAGFGYLTSVIDKFIREIDNKGKQIQASYSKVNLYGMECHAITLTDPDYKFIEFTVSSCETPLTIARNLGINYYSILENNPGIKATEEIATGTKLIIPNDYASKIELYISVDKKYPVKLKVYDPKGLFEEFTYTDVELNPVFEKDVFSADNPKYRF